MKISKFDIMIVITLFNINLFDTFNYIRIFHFNFMSAIYRGFENNMENSMVNSVLQVMYHCRFIRKLVCNSI